MRLHQLKKKGGSLQKRKRLARGPGSGTGKTAGRGFNGSKSRSGYSVRPGFEGGQMPLFRKLPIRGFSNARFRTEHAVVNVGDFDKLEATELNKEALINAGLLRGNTKTFKVLGVGELKKAFSITADHFSKSAIQKIEAAGGKAIQIQKEQPEAAAAA